MEHAIYADNAEIIRQIAIDIEWIDIHLKASQSISGPLSDMETCLEFLKDKVILCISYNY